MCVDYVLEDKGKIEQGEHVVTSLVVIITVVVVVERDRWCGEHVCVEIHRTKQKYNTANIFFKHTRTHSLAHSDLMHIYMCVCVRFSSS